MNKASVAIDDFNLLVQTTELVSINKQYRTYR